MHYEIQRRPVEPSVAEQQGTGDALVDAVRVLLEQPELHHKNVFAAQNAIERVRAALAARHPVALDLVAELCAALRDMLDLHDRMMREANHANSCYQAATFAAMNNAPLRADAALRRMDGSK